MIIFWSLEKPKNYVITYMQYMRKSIFDLSVRAGDDIGKRVGMGEKEGREDKEESEGKRGICLRGEDFHIYLLIAASLLL